jgi:ribosomal protein L40E
MLLFRRLLERVRAWQANRRKPRSVVPSALMSFAHLNASIHREVTANGVRVFSLCGSCGARLNASATLCEECAQKRSKPARPY